MYANPLKSDSGRVRAARLQPQRPFRKSHIPEAPEFAPRFAENRNLFESKSLMQRKRGRIRQRVAANDAVDVLANRFEKGRVKTAANSVPDHIVATVNSGLNARLICRFIAKSRGPCISDHNVVFFSHKQTMTATRGELLKPGYACLHRMRREVKCDRRMDYVVVVNLGKSREIASNSRTNVDVAHNGW